MSQEKNAAQLSDQEMSGETSAAAIDTAPHLRNAASQAHKSALLSASDLMVIMADFALADLGTIECTATRLESAARILRDAAAIHRHEKSK